VDVRCSIPPLVGTVRRLPTGEKTRGSMKKIAVAIAALIYPVFLFAAEIKGTVLKLVPTENRIVLKTERGEETYEITKETKGAQHLKVGAQVTITFSEKDGSPKVLEVTPN
jgi:hypothetical protein